MSAESRGQSRGQSRRCVATGFGLVQAVFESQLERGWASGQSFVAYLNGEPVVELYGGVRDPRAVPALAYDEDTLQLVASFTKVAESLCMALLVDRGLIDYDDRVAQHWPEFAAGDSGKAEVTVRQLMMHRAGLPLFERKLTERELFDPAALDTFLAGQRQVPELFRAEPAGDWRTQDPPPQCYHAVSRGLYASALLRRVDPQHRTLGQFFHDELARPLGLSFWIGLPESEEPRVAPSHADAAVIPTLLGMSGGAPVDLSDPRYQLFDYEREFWRRFLQPDSLIRRGLDCLAFDGVPPQALGNHRKLRACELPSSNGVGTAAALARLGALCAAGGTLGEQRIFRRPDILPRALMTAERYAPDAFMLTEVAFTQGGLARFPATDDPQMDTYGWGGAGGQMVRWVPSLGLGCAYVTNTGGVRMAMNDPRPNGLLAATIDCARKVAAVKELPPLTLGIRGYQGE